MPDRLSQMFQRFLEFWNRYNRKQKAVVLSSLAVVILTLVILVAVLSRPQYEVLVRCENYNEMSQVTTLLTESGYKYSVDEKAMTVSVEKDKIVDAEMLLATNEIEPAGYTYEDALNSSMGTTESDKVKMWETYMEFKLVERLESMDKIEDAQVNLSLKSSENSLFETSEGSSIAVLLTLSDTMDEAEAENIAYWLKTSVENLALKDITILSTTGESLYVGEVISEPGSYTNLNKQLKYAKQLNEVTANEIKKQVMSTEIYGDVKVMVNFDIEWSNFEKVMHEYSVADGNDQGYLSESYLEKSSGGSAVGGTPGTESNDEDTDYEILDGTGNTVEYSLEKNSYLVNELVTTETTSPGEVIKDSSTISAVFTKNVIYREDEAKALGYLEEVTWEEFKAQNAEIVSIEYDETWKEIISTGTGVPVENIAISAYEKHYFYDSEGSGRTFSDYLQILLAIALIGLLAFVVFRSSRPVTVEETEPELSVEQMLATTREKQQSVEDIDLQEKSEVRKAIEKVVDENPEAVALLLRNWLDDGWD